MSGAELTKPEIVRNVDGKGVDASEEARLRREGEVVSMRTLLNQ